MFTSYLKSALRNIARYKGYSLINIAGLAIGVASSLAVFLWVADEISYDKFHENGASIYRCYREVVWNGETRFNSVISAPVGPAAKERTPGIDQYVRSFEARLKLQYETQIASSRHRHVDPCFLTVFSFPLVKGDPATALSAPNSIVLTQEMATRLFGDEDPLGQSLSNGLVVTGIAADVPDNSSIEFESLTNVAYAVQTGYVDPEHWFSFSSSTFFLLRDGADVQQVAGQIKDLFKTVDDEVNLQLHLQPLADMHLKGLNGGGRIVYVYVFSIVAFLLLAVACINFMNLSTARSAKRMTEIGLRKAVGADRAQLVTQILLESTVQAMIAVVLAVCLLEAALPALEGLFQKQLSLTLTASNTLMLLAIALVVGLAAGSYPAFVLSSFKPATVLKGSKTTTGHPSMNRLRKVLVIFQFTVSTGLIFGALVISGQMSFIETKDLGINRDNIIVVRANGLENDYNSFKNELKQHPGILGVTALLDPPAWCGSHIVGFEFEGRPEDVAIRAGWNCIDHDFVDVFGLQIVEGRNISTQYATDENHAILVNEAAVRAMGMDSPIGKTIDSIDYSRKIVGVVKDFHFSSLHEEIEPLLLFVNEADFSYICAKVSDDDVAGSLAFIESKYKQMRPGEDFRYWFFDDLLGREYRAEMQTGKIVLSFTLVTVLVACLGLFGLAAYSAERRTKEIGIRKVLGSSEAGIIGLLTKEFLLLVVLGNVIAAPLAYWATSEWLGSFAYRIKLGWEFFALSSILAVAIALITVCYQAIKAARANPVDALTYE